MGFFSTLWNGTKKCIKGAVDCINNVADFIKYDDGVIASVCRITGDIISIPGTVVSTLTEAAIDATLKVGCMVCGDSLIEANIRVEHIKDKTSDIINSAISSTSKWIDNHTCDGASEAIGNCLSAASKVSGIKAGYKMATSTYKKNYSASLQEDYLQKTKTAQKINSQYNEEIYKKHRSFQEHLKHNKSIRHMEKARRRKLENEYLRKQRDEEIRKTFNENTRKSKKQIYNESIKEDIKNAIDNYKFSFKEKLKDFGRSCLEKLGVKKTPDFLMPYEPVFIPYGTHICPYGCGRPIPNEFKGCIELLAAFPNYFN